MDATSINESIAVSTAPVKVLVDELFLRRYVKNRRFDDDVLYTLVVSYALLVIFGTVANVLIIAAVMRQRRMRLLRHALIVNLAFSDILLCLMTMPLTLIKLVTYSWPFRGWELLCRFSGSLEAVNIFVSTMSIAAIAVDRYKLIVYPTSRGVQYFGAATLLATIWILSITLATPLFVFRKLIHFPIKLRGELALDSVDYCVEAWPSNYASVIYSTAATLLQYIAPIAILILAHAGICHKLRHRIRGANATIAAQNAINGEPPSVTKTNRLLSAVALTFASCWMPLNIYNLVVDTLSIYSQHDVETVLTAYAVCHLAAMTSTCINPLLYGWFNPKLRMEILTIVRCSKTTSTANHGDNTEQRSHFHNPGPITVL